MRQSLDIWAGRAWQDSAAVMIVVSQSKKQRRAPAKPESERTFLNLEQPRVWVSVKNNPSYCRYGDQDEMSTSKCELVDIFSFLHLTDHVDPLDWKCPAPPESARHLLLLPRTEGSRQGLLQTAEVFLHHPSDRENH